MKNLKNFKRIYNIIDILEQEGMIDDKFELNTVNVLGKNENYNMNILFSYSNGNCEEICMISVKFLGEMNFIALVELKYGNGEVEMQKTVTFMNSGLDENLFILNTNDRLQLEPKYCYYYGSLVDGFNKVNTEEIKANVNSTNIRELKR